jgi:hypothetical protein
MGTERVLVERSRVWSIVRRGRVLALGLGGGWVTLAGLAAAEPKRTTPGDDEGGWRDPSGPAPAEAGEPAPLAAEPTPQPDPEPRASPMFRPKILVAPTRRDGESEQPPSTETAIEQEAAFRGAPPSDLALLGSPGVMSYAQDEGGFLAGFSALYRHGLFGGGGFAEAGGLLMGMISVGAMVGIALRTDGGFRTEILGTGGIRHYAGWGKQLLSDDPGASATLPFAGGALRLGYLFGRSRRGHFNLGGLVAVDQDLWRETRTYSYYSSDWLDGSSGYVSRTNTVGGTRWALGVTLGATLDLGR